MNNFEEMVALIKMAKESAYSLGVKRAMEDSKETIAREDLRQCIQTAFEGWSLDQHIVDKDGYRTQVPHNQVVDQLTNFLWNWIGWGQWDANK